MGPTGGAIGATRSRARGGQMSIRSSGEPVVLLLHGEVDGQRAGEGELAEQLLGRRREDDGVAVGVGDGLGEQAPPVLRHPRHLRPADAVEAEVLGPPVLGPEVAERLVRRARDREHRLAHPDPLADLADRRSPFGPVTVTRNRNHGFVRRKSRVPSLVVTSRVTGSETSKPLMQPGEEREGGLADLLDGADRLAGLAGQRVLVAQLEDLAALVQADTRPIGDESSHPSTLPHRPVATPGPPARRRRVPVGSPSAVGFPRSATRGQLATMGRSRTR